MRKTTILEKIFPSLIDVLVVFLVAQLALPFSVDSIGEKWTLIIVFFIYSLVFIFLDEGRDLGMMIFDTYWKKNYSTMSKVIYTVLYTASFATLLFKISFPLDIFLLNIILLQLPAVLITGTTFHGFVAGHMQTVTSDDSE